MKNVDEMSVNEKITELQACVNKARSGEQNPGSVDYEFLLNSKLGDQRGEKLSYYSVLVKNAALMFGGRLNDLDMDVRQQTITEYNRKLDEALLAFPGYERAEEQSRGSR